jgi:HTH-type transcriptional regulator/antitoxin HigA
MTTTTYTPAEVFPPGEYLRDELDERGWTVTEFADIIGRPVQAVSEILNNKKEITAETAVAFGQALGASAAMWLNLQTRYRLFELGENAASATSPVARRARLRDLVPVAELKKRGWLTQTKDPNVLESEVQQLLGISSLDQRPSLAIAARRAHTAGSLTPEQTAWVAFVRHIGRQRSVAAFDLARHGDLAAELPRKLRDPDQGLGKIGQWLGQCGVVLVVVEGLRGSKLDGAVTILEDGRPVIGLTARGDRFDGMLFTLLHECAHLVLGHIGPATAALWLDDNLTDPQTDPIELDANARAAAWIFPDGFPPIAHSMSSIVGTADRYGVHPSLVIGRIQRDTQLWNLHRAQIPKVRGKLGEYEVIR